MRAEQAAAAFSGQRLRLARYRAGLTVRELGERAGVSGPAVSQYEREQTSPSPGVLARLAIGTGLPVGFFTLTRRPVSDNGLAGTHFRSLRSTSRHGREQAWAGSELVLDLADVLERYVRLPDVNLPHIPLSVDAGRAQIEHAAGQLRTAWGLPDGPIGNLVRHAEAGGILVARLPVADRGIDAFSHNQAQRPVIILTTSKSDVARSRFDVAHELGHLICHPDPVPGGLQERQANALAAELLMPRVYIEDVLPSRFDLRAYIQLKHQWGVSIAALLYRAKELRVITSVAYRRAVMILNRQYGPKQEPCPLTRPQLPALLSNAIKLAGKTGVSEQRIAAEACLTLADLRTIVGNPDPRPLVSV